MRVEKLKNLGTYIISLLALLVILIAPVFYARFAYAADLTNRSILLDSSIVSTTTAHTFSFNIASSSLLGSIEFKYCSNSPLPEDPCTIPTGLDLSGVTLESQTGETGFIIDPASDASTIILSRFPDFATPQASSYRFINAVNPGGQPRSYFVRISTFASNDASGPKTDKGSIAFATTRGISVGGFVPPYLTFCVAIIVAADCSSASGNLINLGELLTNQPKFSTSQFAVATNDVTGYSVALAGTTLTSGTNVIDALTVPSASNTGTGQYGINLRQNTNPGVGLNSTGSGTASPTPPYNQVNLFKFTSGESIASVNLPSDFNVFTVSYLVNISTAQPVGRYSATMTYIATASF